MEVKIGIAESPRELVVSSDQTPDEIEALVSDALQSGDGLLRLVDEKGRRYVVRAAQIAYVEIAPADSRKVGFARRRLTPPARHLGYGTDVPDRDSPCRSRLGGSGIALAVCRRRDSPHGATSAEPAPARPRSLGAAPVRRRVDVTVGITHRRAGGRRSRGAEPAEPGAVARPGARAGRRGRRAPAPSSPSTSAWPGPSSRQTRSCSSTPDSPPQMIAVRWSVSAARLIVRRSSHQSPALCTMPTSPCAHTAPRRCPARALQLSPEHRREQRGDLGAGVVDDLRARRRSTGWCTTNRHSSRLVLDAAEERVDDRADDCSRVAARSTSAGTIRASSSAAASWPTARCRSARSAKCRYSTGFVIPAAAAISATDTPGPCVAHRVHARPAPSSRAARGPAAPALHHGSVLASGLTGHAARSVVPYQW